MQRTHAFRIAFCLATAFTFVMAVLPHPPQLPFATSDKAQHMAAFATLSVLGLLAFPGRVTRLIVGLGLFGALIEVVQAIPGLNRSSDWRDLAADLAAILLSVGLLVGVTHLARPAEAEAEAESEG